MEQFVHSDSATVMLFHFSFGLFCLGYQGRDICGTLVLFRFKMIATIFVTVFLQNRFAKRTGLRKTVYSLLLVVMVL